jgi:hypothetical protein
MEEEERFDETSQTETEYLHVQQAALFSRYFRKQTE